MSSLIIGKPFAAAIDHTILPVAELVTSSRRPGSGDIRIVGFFPIASTSFDGNETTFNLNSGAVNVTSVHLPPDYTKERASEFMIAWYDVDDARHEQWRGHPSFVSAADSGFYSRWILAETSVTQRQGNGTLIGSLVKGLDVTTYVPPSSPTAPTAANGSLRWAVSISLVDLDCAFFDFNWVDLFNAKPPVGVVPAGLTGLAIVPTSQPAGLPFKSTVVQTSMIGANNTLIYNTVRIIKLQQAVAPDDYTFDFSIGYTNEQGITASTPVTLTLTVV